ncbi:MAG: RIP metalloprotease RseP [Chloroflexi bacterium]|nr:RIP metalloprotease RseP [Chloroflexota bacterium]
MISSILWFLVVIVGLVLAHEIGHFVTAKASGVRVDEFGIGFPPRLFGIKRGETVYSINLIPLGGFVKLAGEEDPKVPRSLASKSIGTRILILSAGSVMNFLLPILLFSIAFIVPHDVAVGKVVVQEVAADSPAARAGIRPGDTLVNVNGKVINNNGDLHRNVQLNMGMKITIVVKHADSTTESVRLVPRWKPPAGQGAIGVAIQTLDLALVRQSEPFWRAIPMGASSLIETFVLFKNGIVSMIVGTAPVEVAGPVGIAQLTGEVAKAGLSPLLQFAAFLSINLAIINIFPLPALDGGRIAFVLLEGLRRGKRIPARTEALVHLIGFILLMAFIAAVTYKDIIRIISGDSLIP